MIVVHLLVEDKDVQKGMIKGRIIKMERYWRPDGKMWEKRPDINRLPYTDEHGITFVVPRIGYKNVGDTIWLHEVDVSKSYPIK